MKYTQDSGDRTLYCRVYTSRVPNIRVSVLRNQCAPEKQRNREDTGQN